MYGVRNHDIFPVDGPTLACEVASRRDGHSVPLLGALFFCPFSTLMDGRSRWSLDPLCSRNFWPCSQGTQNKVWNLDEMQGGGAEG